MKPNVAKNPRAEAATILCRGGINPSSWQSQKALPTTRKTGSRSDVRVCIFALSHALAPQEIWFRVELAPMLTSWPHSENPAAIHRNN